MSLILNFNEMYLPKTLTLRVHSDESDEIRIVLFTE